MKRFIILLIIGMLFFGCTNYGSGTQVGGQIQGSKIAGTSDSVTTNIHIKNFVFDSAVVTIKQGDSVTWINDDAIPHSIKTVGSQFESTVLSTGASFTHKFTEAPGEYDYFCGIHTSMRGKVIVTK